MVNLLHRHVPVCDGCEIFDVLCNQTIQCFVIADTFGCINHPFKMSLPILVNGIYYYIDPIVGSSAPLLAVVVIVLIASCTYIYYG